MAVQDGDELVYIERIKTRQIVTINLHIGSRLTSPRGDGGDRCDLKSPAAASSPLTAIRVSSDKGSKTATTVISSTTTPGGRQRHCVVGVWVKGGTRAEMVVRTRIPLTKLTVRVNNVSVENQIQVCVPGECTKDDYRPGENKILELSAGPGFPYEDFGARSYCYLVSIAPKLGEVPLLVRRDSGDDRYLGAFIHISPDPYPGI